jgi:hypothetical protein
MLARPFKTKTRLEAEQPASAAASALAHIKRDIVGQGVDFGRLTAARSTDGVVEGPLLRRQPSGGL